MPEISFDDLVPKKPPASARGVGFDDLVPAKERAWADVPGEAISNVPKSAKEFVGNIGHAVMHPVETGTNMKNLALGLAEYAGIGGSSHKQYADAVGRMIKDRYGSADALKRSLATDPVGVMADFSSVLSGGGAVLRGTSTLARAAGATRAADVAGAVGEAASAAGRATDPVAGALKGVKAAKEVALGPGKAKEVAELEQANVLLTPGQRFGRVAKGIEDRAASFPILDYFIGQGRGASIETFNEAVGARALAPIGEKVTTKAGHDLITEVRDKLGAAYDRLLPQMQFRPDAQLGKALVDIQRNQINRLRPEFRQQYTSILKSIARDRFRRYLGRPIPGTEFKLMQSELTNLSSRFMKSQNPDQYLLGRALESVEGAAMAALERSNPAQARKLARINTGWAMYKRMEDAAVRRKGSTGVFNPQDLITAIGTSSQRGPFARGNAIMQRFAEAGKKVLPSEVPESGTAGRAMLGRIMEGALIGGAAINPAVAMKAAAVGAPIAARYTRPGMAAAHHLRRSGIVPRSPNVLYQAGRVDDALAPPQDSLSQ